MRYGKYLYYSQDWIITSAFIKKIYQKKCMKCGDKKSELHTDHIIPRSIDPRLELDVNNLQILCKKCNLEKSNKESIDYRSDRDKEMLKRNLPYVPILDRDKKIELQKWIKYNSQFLTYIEMVKLIDLLKHFDIKIDNDLDTYCN